MFTLAKKYLNSKFVPFILILLSPALFIFGTSLTNILSKSNADYLLISTKVFSTFWVFTLLIYIIHIIYSLCLARILKAFIEIALLALYLLVFYYTIIADLQWVKDI